MATKRPYLLHNDAELYAIMCILSLEDRKTLASSELKDVHKLFVSISKNTKVELSIPNYNENKKKLSTFFSKLSKQTEATIFMKEFVDVTTANTDGVITLSTSVKPEQIRKLYDKKNDFVLNYMYTYLFFLLGDDFYELLDTHQTGGQHLVRFFHVPLTDIQRVRFINYLQTHYANNEILLHLASEVQDRSTLFDWHYFQTMYRQILEAIDAVGIDPTLIRELIRRTDRNQLDPVGWTATPAVQQQPQQPQQYYQPPQPHPSPIPQHPSNFLPMLAVAQQIPVSQQQQKKRKNQKLSKNDIIQKIYENGEPGDIISEKLHRRYAIGFRSVEEALMRRYNRLKNDPSVDHVTEYERMQNFLFDLAVANVQDNRDSNPSNEFLRNRAAMIKRANQVAYEMNRSYLQYARNTAVQIIPAALNVAVTTAIIANIGHIKFSQYMNPSWLTQLGRMIFRTTEEEQTAIIIDFGIKCVTAIGTGAVIGTGARYALTRTDAENLEQLRNLITMNYEYQQMIAQRNWGIIQNGLKLGANAFLIYAGGHAAGGVARGMSELGKAGLDSLTQFASDGKKKTFSYPSSSSASSSSSTEVTALPPTNSRSAEASSSAASSRDAITNEFNRWMAEPGAAARSAEQGATPRINRSKFATKSNSARQDATARIKRSKSSTSATASVSNSASVPHPAPVLAQQYVANPPPVLAQPYVPNPAPVLAQQYVAPTSSFNHRRVSYPAPVPQPAPVLAQPYSAKYEPVFNNNLPPHLEEDPDLPPPRSGLQRNVIYTANNSTNDNNNSNNEGGLTYRPMTKEERQGYPNSNSDGGRRRKYSTRKTKNKKRHTKHHTKRHTKRHNRK
jgi:hypothetical protein